MRHKYHTLTSLLTSDIRQRGVGHVCNGCCEGPEECAEKITDALAEVSVMELGSNLPASNKWWTHEKSMVTESALDLIHDLGAEVLPESLGAAGSDEENADVDDFPPARHKGS